MAWRFTAAAPELTGGVAIIVFAILFDPVARGLWVVLIELTDAGQERDYLVGVCPAAWRPLRAATACDGWYPAPG